MLNPELCFVETAADGSKVWVEVLFLTQSSALRVVGGGGSGTGFVGGLLSSKLGGGAIKLSNDCSPESGKAERNDGGGLNLECTA